MPKAKIWIHVNPSIPIEEIPELSKKIRIGDFIKIRVCFEGLLNSSESFWTIVEKVEGTIITAKVDNELFYTKYHKIKLHHKIQYTLANGIDLLDADSNSRASRTAGKE